MPKLGAARRSTPRAKRTVIIVVCVFVAVVAISAIPRGSPVRAFFHMLTRPVQSLFAPSPGSEKASMEALRRENDELIAKLAKAELDAQQTAEKLRAAQDAAALAGFALDHPEYNWVHARVIARDPGTWFTQYTIDRGRKDGVRVGAVVVTEAGVVGRVVRLDEDDRAVIMAVIDGASKAACASERTREQGLCEGIMFTRMSAPRMTLAFFSENADILPGDKIVTTGADGVYPRGFTLGKVTEITPGTESAKPQILVEPSVEFSKLSAVLVAGA
ncbi:MAG: rod shape-determining protein MreC [Clostridia bacterium]|nr:rod shape-determining protein MreC [Clostridia bacterium]